MILSNYTFLFENKGAYFMFNSLSKAFLEIDQESFAILVERQKTKTEISEDELDSDLYKELVKRLFICNNHKDELLIYKSTVMNRRNQNSSMHLTIAPTMDCCFECFYCFEKNTNKSYITDDVIDAIIKNIEHRPNIQSLRLTWFGGEPLMAIDKMQDFYRKFRPTFKGEFASNIITTAFHIDERVIDILKEIEVTSMQITLDGMEATHNAIKFTAGCDNAFRRVISNIDLLVERYPELNIVVRVNTTKENSDEFIELYKFIVSRYRGKRVNSSPSPVMNRTNDEKITNLFNHSEFSKFSIDLWATHRIVSSWFMYQHSPVSECAIRNINALSVDPEGYVYQCWENIGNKERIIGKLNTEGNLVNINQIELNRNLYGADPLSDPKCMKCSYLPMCGGGCPIQRIQNEFEGGRNELCTTYKNHIGDWLSAYLELKQLGILGKKEEKTEVEN